MYMMFRSLLNMQMEKDSIYYLVSSIEPYMRYKQSDLNNHNNLV